MHLVLIFFFHFTVSFRYHILQADSEEACRHWVASLQAGIDAAYNGHCIGDNFETSDSIDSSDTSLSSNSLRSAGNLSQSTSGGGPPKPPRVHPIITGLPGNEFCADCQSNDPKWASINLGITLCIECSGVHRSLGVHISKVKSLILDAWDSEQIKLMLALGNTVVNSFYEEKVDETIAVRPNSSSNPSERELWIKAKYVKKDFVLKSLESKDKHSTLTSNDFTNNLSENCENNTNIGSFDNRLSIEYDELNQLYAVIKEAEEELTHAAGIDGNSVSMASNLSLQYKNYFNLMLYSAAKDANAQLMCKAICKGAQVNWSNYDDEGMTPLHQLVLTGSVPCCEYLLLNGAKCNSQDSLGRSPLHLATEKSDTGLVINLISCLIVSNS